MKKAFLSYNRDNEPVAKIIVEAMGSLGFDVWLDLELSGGQAWWDKILATIRDCNVFVFLLDAKSLDSIACNRELDYASALGKPILPILIGEGVSMDILPPELSRLNIIDYRRQDHRSAISLAKALNNIPQDIFLPDPLPSPPEIPVSYRSSLMRRIQDEAALSYEEQSALLVDLRRSMKEAEAVENTRMMLKKFRERRDLLAVIAEQIEEMLNSINPNLHTPSANEDIHTFKFPRWLIGVFAVIVPGIVIYMLWSNVTQEYKMRNVIGMNINEAKEVLNKLLQVDLEINKIKTKDTPAGIIVDQRPAAGSSIQVNQRVYLEVAEEPGLSIPDVVGMNIDAAKEALNESGLGEPDIKIIKTNDKPAGRVISQRPSAGMIVQAGQRVVLEIAEELGSIMPNVLGKMIDEARAVLSEAGISGKVITVRQERSKRPPDTVIEQTPERGTPLLSGQDVELVVAFEPGISEKDRRMATELGHVFFTSIQKKNIKNLVEMSSLPFFFDNRVISSMGELENTYSEILRTQNFDSSKWRLQEITAKSITEYLSEGLDREGDRLLREIKLNDDDFRVIIYWAEGTKREGVAIYTRKLDGDIKIAGFWN